MTMRRCCLAGLLVCALASVLVARQAVVKTKDGQTLQGDLDDASSPDIVFITVHGVKVTVDRRNILSIDYPENIEEQFNTKMSKLGPTDVNGRLELAHWAFDNHEYELAREAAESVLKIDAVNHDAVDMLELIHQQISMEQRHPPAETAHTADTGPTTAPSDADRHMLSNDDINIIRQAELRAGDAKVQINFMHEVKKRYLANGQHDAKLFNAKTPLEQAIEILNNGDVRLAGDVRLTTDPSALIEYHQLQPRILSGCAAAGCHNSSSTGKSFVLLTGPDVTPSWYTNFYILQAYTREVDGGATFGGMVQRPMIDRQHPELSLLVQYGLPPAQAITPHPKVQGFRPLFQTKDAPFYISLVTWIGRSLKPQVPDYGIRFDLPGARPATQPATQPIAKPALPPATNPSAPPTPSPVAHAPTPPAIKQ